MRQKLEEVHDRQTLAVEAYQKAVEVSMKRYKAGNAGYFEVLEAQQQLFPVENALAQTHLNRLLVIVRLYKALGGWRTESSESPDSNRDRPSDSRLGFENNAG